MRKLKAALSLLALSALVLTLTACGKSAESNSNDKKQVLNLSATAPLDTIDISKASGYGQTGNVFESFYRLGKNGKVSPGLAKSSSVSKDGKTWTFKLRNAKWSNGDKITARDFVYSWRRTLTPKTKSTYAYLFSGIQNADDISAGKKAPSSVGISAPDSKTVVIKLDKPIAYFKVLMAYPLFGPQNQKVVEKYGKKYATKSQYMVYSGPFKIKKWNGTGNKWQFVKNNQYWDKKVVKLREINYLVVESPTTGQELYQQGKLDLTPLAGQQVKNFKHSSQFKQYPYSYVSYLQYNFKDSDPVKRAAFNNQNIRLALSLAIDRDVLIQKILGNGSQTPKGFVASDLASDPQTGKDFADQQFVKNTVKRDTKLAKQHWTQGLKEIGQKKLDLSLLASNDDSNGSVIAQYLQSTYAKVLPGLNIKVNSIPGKNAQQNALQGNFDIFLSGWGGDFNDPITFLQIPESNTAYNYGKYSSAKYDELIRRAQNDDANDQHKRWSDLVQAARLLNSEQGMTPVYQQVTAYLQKNDIKGIIHNTAGAQWNYKYAYKK
ncbi:oligopeptide ABC transporter [Liquorilactobacillus sucicola DSM 21376 = JCM 15457]|uniref:Oligopeptide ABC superfamily ATP binding cassette transporter, binding protein n=1 Tax=Liquorilactobacillus sucicola DSM 21376 = JCM 15457 TaxID=1423806 RepID=A0A023CWH4_9LACO|nr:peptide ABC transporter substrate-binding protein [Liquorilactobacillus sucicola]KRN06268.1 oligopeptide ABC superfamily ATP binding cassette transporter, binding protein [Liquorilactobacillus sucicola DSM 21376 = JCM 15457]GAJ26207.1 oligopeptide ABC transporter [Liquorilactobacillus sucicola DSM 21376 = JCM 15457]